MTGDFSSGRAARIPDTGTCVAACRWAEVQASWGGGRLGKRADVVSQACASPLASVLQPCRGFRVQTLNCRARKFVCEAAQ